VRRRPDPLCGRGIDISEPPVPRVFRDQIPDRAEERRLSKTQLCACSGRRGAAQPDRGIRCAIVLSGPVRGTRHAPRPLRRAGTRSL
jgi:hypothetical protein